MLDITRSIRLLLITALFAAAAWALAEGTAANETIQNVATATYNDSAGDPQVSTSNPVTTIVQQVYSLTITPDGSETVPGQTETALPGANVYFNYIVTNTGNGTDTISLSTSQTLSTATDDLDLSGVTLYYDEDCDGSVAGDPTVTSVTLDADASACIIVAGTIPGTAADGDNALINLSGSSDGSGGASTDTDNWAEAVANTAGNLTANKVASPSSTVAAGGTISYTISGSNNGGAAAYGVSTTVDAAAVIGIAITDVLDSDVTYTASSLSGTAGAGTVLPIYSTDGGATWTATEPGSGVNAVGIIIQDPAPTSAFFPQSANYSMSFSVSVDSGASATTAVTNSAVVAYDTDADNGNGTSSTTTNTTTVTVSAAYSVAIGPEGNATTDGLSGTASYTDPATGDTWNVSLSGGYTTTDDTQTITDAVYTGDTVSFKHTIENDGNASSSYTVSASSAQGYTVTLYQADGVTPLLGAIGPLAPGDTQDVVVKVAIPVGATLGDTVTVSATSSTSGATDTTTDVIPAPLSGFGVDVAQQGDTTVGNDADDTLGSQAANPGTVLEYPVVVRNTGEQDDSYDLSATLPAGWTVEFVEDANCDGTADGASVTSTPSLNSGDTVCYVAQVTIPAGAAPSSGNTVDLSATSNTDPSVSNTVSGTVDVNTVADITFVSDQVATTSPNGVVTYTHTLTNNGNDTASVDIPAQSGTDFTYQYSTDGTTWTTALSGVSVAAGATQPIYVRVIVPDTAVDGDTEAVTVTATATYPSSDTSVDSVQDTTIVQAGELDLVKSAQTCDDAACVTVNDATGATAEPGDYIEYTIVASNIGSGDLSNVKVSDPQPSFTDFVSVTAVSTASGTVLYSTDGTSWSTSAPVALSAGQTIYAAVDTNADTDITTDDVLAPSETITLTFVVQVQ